MRLDKEVKRQAFIDGKFIDYDSCSEEKKPLHSGMIFLGTSNTLMINGVVSKYKNIHYIFKNAPCK